MKKIVFCFAFFLTGVAFAQNPCDTEDCIEVVCGDLCTDPGFDDDPNGSGGGGGAAGNDGDSGAGGAGNIPHIGPDIQENPNNPHDEPTSCANSQAGLRFQHVSSDVGYSRARTIFQGGLPLQGSPFTVSYANGYKESWIAGPASATVGAGTPIPGTCHR